MPVNKHISQGAQKRLECFIGKILADGMVPYSKLVGAAIASGASPFRPSPLEMDACVAEIVFWLTKYNISNDLPEDYELTERPYEEDKDDYQEDSKDAL